nr:ATP-binding cassette domain-containing protein [Paenibacillus dendritiformis]
MKKGGIYCMVGRNGTAKSTLINTLLGIHEDYDGEIMIEGNDLESLDKYNLRSKLIGVIEQEPCLLEPFIENLSQTDYPAFIRTFELERVIEAIKDNEKQNCVRYQIGGENQRSAS